MSVDRWAVVTGLVRQADVGLAKLKTLADWVDQGFLDGVCVSWWRGEGERQPRIADAIRDFGFTLVETHEPRLKTLGHYVHQCKSLWCGLQATPPGVMVLKTRFDLHPLAEAMRARIVQTDLTIETLPGWPSPLRCKILAPWALAGSPFYIGDITFYGMRDDLLQLTAFNLGPEYMFSGYMPEQFFHWAPFRGCFPLLEEYSLFMPPLIFDQPDQSAARNRLLLAADYYLDVLACHVLVLDSFYELGMEKDSIGLDYSDAGLEGLLTGVASKPDLYLLPGPHAVMLMGSGAVRALASGRVALDGLGRRYCAALERVRDYGYQRRFEANPLRLGVEAARLKAALDAFPEACPRIGERNPDTGAWEISGHADRVAFLGDSDQVAQLRAEISELRRQLDSLRGLDAAFGGGRP